MPAAQAATLVELRLRAASPGVVPAVGRVPSPRSIEFVAARDVPGRVQRLRGTRATPFEVVVVGLDAAGDEVTRNVVADPRRARAERGGAGGARGGGEHYRGTVTLHVLVDDFERVATLALFAPRGRGAGQRLEPLGRVDLAR